MQLIQQSLLPYEVTMVHNGVECKVKSIGDGCNVGKLWIQPNRNEGTVNEQTFTLAGK